MSRTNYIFIDYENVQETDLDRIKDKPVKVVFVLGERHKSLPVTLVKQILPHAGQVELVETRRGGKNALDLVLAEHVGEAKKADPLGYFHIMSKDKDFDALIGHLKDEGVRAARRESFSEIPALMTPVERSKHMELQLRQNPAHCPKKRTALENHIQTTFGKTLPTEEVEQMIEGLIREKIITLSEHGDCRSAVAA